jgi:lysophospholipase L1-like esterase
MQPFRDAAAPKARWTTSWAGSVQGPYPIGNPSAQPNLDLVFPSADVGARDQSFRLILRPDVWGTHTRLRFSNAFGTKPLSFDDVYVGLQLSSSALIRGSNQPVRFGGQKSVTVAPGDSVWSDAVELPFVREAKDMAGRKMAVSFQIFGESGPMTWHAKALTTSYVTLPGAGSQGRAEEETAFPAPTASWFFLNAVDMKMPASTHLIVALGDSITDGTGSTLNGDDRWTDVLSRRLHSLYGEQVVVVNAGIGGNQVVGPREYSPQQPVPGGPSALSRLERDVLTLSNVGTVIWLEGINDFSKNGNATAEAVADGMKQGVARIRAGIPGVRVIGATVTSALGSTSEAHGFTEQDEKRKTLNEFIRHSGTFDAVLDFDSVILDPATGGMRAEFVPDSTTGDVGDKLHPNRLGYRAMGMAIDLSTLVPSLVQSGEVSQPA